VFPLALSGPRLSLGGDYTLAIDMVGSCNSLPAELHHRRYDAVVMQDGIDLEVRLTEPRFRLNAFNKGNRFTGRADAGGATFTLDKYASVGGRYYYYYYTGATDYPSIAEQLADGNFFVPSGIAVTTAAGGGLSGRLDGGMSRWGPGFPASVSWNGACFSPNLQFTLTPK
jgi:hypothetical protein